MAKRDPKGHPAPGDPGLATSRVSGCVDMPPDADSSSPSRRVGAAARQRAAQLEVPNWYSRVGLGAWFTLGILAVVAVVLLWLALVAEVAIPLALAAVLAAVLVPLTNRLERWHVPRWLGATLVLILGLALVAGTIILVIRGITSQSDEIWAQINTSLQKMDKEAGAPSSDAAALTSAAHEIVRVLTTGILGSLFSSAASLFVGFVLAVFMLLFLLKDWVKITDWTSTHLGLPAPIGRTVLDGTVDAFRGYAGGLTLIGAANALVVSIGALLLGVPLVGTIALVTFITSYVPYLGAFVAGAFAVLIAYGSGGLGDAAAMFAIVMIANNSIQNLVEPFAFGTRLRLHPLAVLLTVTTATMLFGIMGAVLAAPLASASVNAYHQIRDAGLMGAGQGVPD